MKKIFCIVYSVFSLALLSCSGDIFDNIREHASTEKVYVGKYDKADIYVGINRLEIDLLDAGRIPADQVSVGKAVNTVVEYDGVEHPYPGVYSWINIPNLKEQKLYRIKIYNVDELGNKSLPVEAAAIPFTDDDVAALAVPVPQKLMATGSIQLNWSTGMTSSFFDFYLMEYSYTDAAGVSKTDTTSDENSIMILNLAEGSAGAVTLRLKVLPKQDEVPILDTVYLETVIDYKLPTVAEYLAARVNRQVTYPYQNGPDGELSWGETTDHLVFSEVMYETSSGIMTTLRVPTTEISTVCPDAKQGGLFQTRSAFVAPGSIDTLYKNWTSGHPFFTFPGGTFKVDPNSYRSYGSGELTAAIPQSEYSKNNTVIIERVGEDTYRISDLIGGFYEPGRDGYGEDYILYGTFKFTDFNSEWPVIEYHCPWEDYGFSRLSGSYDAATRTLYLTVPWTTNAVIADNDYVFNLILKKQ